MGRSSEKAAVILPDPVNKCGGVVMLVMLFALVTIPCFIFYNDAYPLQFTRFSCTTTNTTTTNEFSDSAPLINELVQLERVLKAAAMEDKTVILTTLNEAWAAPNSVLDLFLESFKIGENITHILSHLVIICMDQKAYERCLKLHPHCYALNADGVDFTVEAYFLSPDYLKMVWRKIDFQRSVLELGYNFLFTDADIMWFREPFTRFYEDTDLQVSCDKYLFNDSYDMNNQPNSGFKYVKSNNRTVKFYKFWYDSRIKYPNEHDQDVLAKIKYDPYVKEIALKIRFLDTLYFGGLCEPSKDLNQVRTMHANCCFGLENKIHDLNVVLNDWRNYTALTPGGKRKAAWTGAQDCLKQYDVNYVPKKVKHEGKKD